MNFFIGGYTWDKSSLKDTFINAGYWENGYKDGRYQDIVSQIKVGDAFALKSTYVQDGKSYLRIHCKGVVTGILSDTKIRIKWIDNEIENITDITWYANTLVKIDNEEHISKIFHISTIDYFKELTDAKEMDIRSNGQK